MQITESVFQLDTTVRAHVFLIKQEECVLIDTGFPGEGPKIVTELENLLGTEHSIKHIMLTHADVDHAGNVAYLQDKYHSQVWIGKYDQPFLAGSKRPAGVKWLLSHIMRVPAFTRSNTYTEASPVAGVNPYSAPGHTPGHTILQYKNVVFAGDLLQNKGKLATLPGFFTWDKARLRQSLAIPARLHPDWLCPAHGEPIQCNEKTWDQINIIACK